MEIRVMTRRLTVAACLLAALPQLGTAVAGDSACASRPNNTQSKLLECVTLDGVRSHQAVFQAIADANGGMRTSGAPGYDQSAAYVVEVLMDAGYRVTEQHFQYMKFFSLSPPVLEQVSPPPAGAVPNSIMSYSGSGDVTASVSTLSLTTGCAAGDFAGFPAGDIALIERGTCTFALKATNAYNAGASGVVIYNNTAGDLNGTLTSDFTLDIPVTSVTQSVGTQLAATPGLIMRLKTETFRGMVNVSNVIAETVGGNPDNVVMAGAHLDSVPAGPGINDNGSGAATLLEIAVQMANVNPRNKVRFAFWGGYEDGLVGSTYYVNQLSMPEKERIALYLDAHALGSPNYVFFVFDGDDSAAEGEGPGPEGSGAIEAAFTEYFALAGQPLKEIDLNPFTSDFGPFTSVGIPAGGLFAGLIGIKTAEEAGLWGGVAGEQYDPCYHLACDTFDNVSLAALETNADAMASVVLRYARSTEDVNGVASRGNSATPPGIGRVCE